MLRHASSLAFEHASRTASRAVGSRSASTLTQLVDGSVWQFKSRKGTLVGEDHLGNKYYENMAYQSGRHRWVEYKDLDGGWSTYNASSIPPEWHGWLNHVDDKPGLTDSKEPIYAVKMIGPANSGEPDMYQPKGSFLNKQGIKNWKRYTAWTPP